MMETTFEPLTVRLLFHSKTAVDLGCWGSMVCRFMERLTREIEDAGPCVVGHLKGFARCWDKEFIKVSTVSARHPADIVVSDPKKTASELPFILIVLVYGHPRKTLADLVRKTSKTPAQSWSGHISILQAASAGQTINAAMDPADQPK